MFLVDDLTTLLMSTSDGFRKSRGSLPIVLGGRKCGLGLGHAWEACVRMTG